MLAAVCALGAPRAARAQDMHPMKVIVRDGGDPLGGLAVTRLRGQVADLPLDVSFAQEPLEPTLDAQVDAAERLADEEGAHAIVWFVARHGGLDVAVATPGDRRLFVRSIPPDDASAVAEAAAIAARGALRAIADGGTIGVALPPPPPRAHLEAALGWQIAWDGGADRGAQALAQRTMIARGAWAFGLALTLGPPLERAGDATVELSRSGAAIAIERRLGLGFALGVDAGALLYHRATVSPPGGLAATPSAFTTALAAGPVLRWRWRPHGAPLAIEATAAVDVVAGAPELEVMDATGVRTIGAIRAVQPRLGLSIVAGL